MAGRDSGIDSKSPGLHWCQIQGRKCFVMNLMRMLAAHGACLSMPVCTWHVKAVTVIRTASVERPSASQTPVVGFFWTQTSTHSLHLNDSYSSLRPQHVNGGGLKGPGRRCAVDSLCSRAQRGGSDATQVRSTNCSRLTSCALDEKITTQIKEDF